MKKFVLTIVVIIGLLAGFVNGTQAEVNCDISGASGQCLDISRQIAEFSKQLEMSQAATTPLVEQARSLDVKMNAIQRQIDTAVIKQKQMQKNIEAREGLMAKQYGVLTQKTRSFYKQLRSQSVLTMILATAGDGNMKRELNYQSEMNDRDRQLIVELSKEIIGLGQDKEKLDRQNKQLAALQADLDSQGDKLKAVIKEAKSVLANFLT